MISSSSKSSARTTSRRLMLAAILTTVSLSVVHTTTAADLSAVGLAKAEPAVPGGTPPTAAAYQAGPPDLYQAKGAYVRLEVVLEHAQGEGRSLSLFIHGTGDGRFTTGWIQGLHAQTNLPYGLVAEALRLDGNALRGEIRSDAICPDLTFEIEAGVQDGRVQGTFKGLITGRSRQGTPTKTEVKGVISGRLVTEDDLRKRNTLAPGRDYPCHRGPIGSGAAVDCGRELVQSFADAKLVWKSEENFVPGAWGARTWGVGLIPDSNYGGVAVADGRVYVYYTSHVLVPNETATNPPPAAASSQRSEPAANPHVAWIKDVRGISVLTEVNPTAGPRTAWTPSDPYRGAFTKLRSLDRILCLDAANGRTLWRTSWPGISFCLKAANHSTPCVADGVVVVQSGMYMIYALDAATGAMRWSNADTFAATENFKNLRDNPETVQARPVNQVSPLAADGVVMVLGLGKGGSALGLGLEVATGKVLWKAPGASPRQLWVHGGKTYFLSRTAAFEPKTGKVLWTLGDQKSRQDITVACENYAVTQGGEQLRCYRITPEKAEQIWTLPWKGSQYMDGPVIHRDHLYAIGHFTDGRDQEKSSDGKPVGCLWCIQLPTGTVVGSQRGSDSPEMLAAEGLILDQRYRSAWRAAPGPFELLSKPSGGDQQDQRFLFPAACWAPAAIADGRYFARLDMFCMGLACWDLRVPLK